MVMVFNFTLAAAHWRKSYKRITRSRSFFWSCNNWRLTTMCNDERNRHSVDCGGTFATSSIPVNSGSREMYCKWVKRVSPTMRFQLLRQ